MNDQLSKNLASPLAVAEFTAQTNRYWDSATPHTSLIMACYRVENYLPTFLQSLSDQIADHNGYELIFVIDGCPEKSEEIVKLWASSTGYAVRILVKANGGVASARNLGLQHARGDWVSCPDPDDWLDPRYLAEIESAREEFPSVNMCTGRVALIDTHGKHVAHPMEFRFNQSRARLVDLAHEPDSIQTLGGTVFFRRVNIESTHLTFDEGLLQASDTDFLMRFLLRSDSKYVIVPAAIYEYRRRADGSSIVDTQARNETRYKTVFGRTHRAILELAGPECPQWLANTLLYFIYWPFKRCNDAISKKSNLSKTDQVEIDFALRENLRRIGARQINAFRLIEVPLDIRFAWLSATEGSQVSTPVVRERTTVPGDLSRVHFYSLSPSMPRGLSVAGEAAELVGTNSRSVQFFGTTWLFEHVVVIRSRDDASFSLSADDEISFSHSGVPLLAGEIRRLQDQDKPHSSFVAQTSTGKLDTAYRFLRTNLQRTRWALPFRLASLLRKDRAYSRAVVFYAGDGSNLEAWAPLLQTATPPLRGRVWLVAPSKPPALFQHIPWLKYARRGSITHFLLLKFARIVVTSDLTQSPRAPIPRSVLSQTWRLIYIPSEAPSKYDHRVLSLTPYDKIIVSNFEEKMYYLRPGGDYRLVPSQIVLLEDFRDNADEQSLDYVLNATKP